jgi:hypothetical protein
MRPSVLLGGLRVALTQSVFTLLRAFGQQFADHARYASLLLSRPADTAVAGRVRAAIATLTARAVAAGTVSPAVRADDVMAIISAMRGLIQAGGDIGPGSWPRFLGIHLAGLRSVQDPGTTLPSTGIGRLS